eukprot:7890765-Pyramimonas_sp.AAC.1
MGRHPNQLDVFFPDVIDFPDNLPPDLPVWLGRATLYLWALLEGQQQVPVICHDRGSGRHEGQGHQERVVLGKS